MGVPTAGNDNSLMNITADFDIDLEEIDDRLEELQDTMDQLHSNLDNVQMFKIVSKVKLFLSCRTSLLLRLKKQKSCRLLINSKP